MVAAGVATHHYDLLEILERYPYGSEARTKLLGELLQEDWDAIRKWLCGGGAPDVTRWGFGSLPALRQLTPDQALTESMRTLVSFRERLEQYDATDRKALAARAVRGLVTLADHAGLPMSAMDGLLLWRASSDYRSILKNPAGLSSGHTSERVRKSMGMRC
jgi:hypothetical protein